MKMLLYGSYLFFLLLAFLVATEAYFGYRAEGEIQEPVGERFVRLKEFPPDRIFTRRANDDYLARSHGLDGRDFYLHTDEDGYILPTYFGKSDATADYRVLFLGGSTTESLYVAQEYRWPNYSGALLAESSGKNIEILNSGVSGGHAYHSINILLNKALQKKLDVVVLFHNINDLSFLLGNGAYHTKDAPPGKTLIVRPDDSLNPFVSTLVSIKNDYFFYTWSFLRNAFSIELQDDLRRLENAKHQEEYKRRLEMNLAPEKFASIEQEFGRALRVFVSICRVYGIRPVLVTQGLVDFGEIDEPYEKNIIALTPMDYRQLLEHHAKFNSVIEGVAAQEEVDLFDLAQFSNKDFVYDIVHFNQAGSKRVAEYVSQKLLHFISAE